MENTWMPDLSGFRAVQVATIHGAAHSCNSAFHPTILVRLDNAETQDWIYENVFANVKSESFNTKNPNEFVSFHINMHLSFILQILKDQRFRAVTLGFINFKCFLNMTFLIFYILV